MLNGRFDLAYERRHFSGGPFEASSVNALRSYHHFLFLSHDAAGDPCGLSVEILTLQFWEAHCRVPGLPAPLRLTVAGGKIVVPFGADPLYHQNYGGLGGFDQPMLPVIWAVEGAAAHLIVERREFVLTDDLFVVRGFALPHADSIINLQSGFSPDDDAELGWGNRLGAAWRFVSAWYSAYYNPLGFGRRLFMQAVRPHGLRGRAASRSCSTSASARACCAPMSRAAAPGSAAWASTTTTSPTTSSSATTRPTGSTSSTARAADLQQPPGRRARQVRG